MIESVLIGLETSWPVVAALLWVSFYLSRTLNAIKNHKHDKNGVAYLPEKIEI